jgi:L-methionine (R)-S-oxide reductase
MYSYTEVYQKKRKGEIFHDICIILTMKAKYEKLLQTITETISANTIWRYMLNDVVFDLKNGNPRYDWVGIYLLEENTLRLETFLGQPTEHTLIEVPKGVCGEAASKKKTMVVSDVSNCGNYISCSLHVKSEIVVPILRNGTVLGVIDIDSHTKAAFTKEDQAFLEKVASLIADKAPFVQKQTHP